MRQFYIIFSNWHAVSADLSWNTLKVDSEKVRDFYINESIKGHCGTRTLEREILTQLYERTLLAKKNTETIIDLVEEVKANEQEQRLYED